MKKILCLLTLFLIPFFLNPHPRGFKTHSSATRTISKQRAQFLPAYKALRTWEGNYSNHPFDKGGETYAGITRVYTSNWYGWHLINEYKKQSHCGFKHIHIVRCYQPKWNQQLDPLIEHYVLDYYIDIWFREGFDQLNDQQVANYLFDFRVNGTVSIVLTRKVLNDIGSKIEINNEMGPDVISAINSLNPDTFISALKNNRTLFYSQIVMRHPDQKVFIKEWLKRAKFGGTHRIDV